MSAETSTISLVEQINAIEKSLKELKRVARTELKARRRRRGSKREGGEKAKGETPQQLKAWHDEVRKVWDEMRKVDAKTPYKRAVAEASSRRKTTGGAAPVVVAPVVTKTKKEKVAKEEVAAPAPVVEEKKAVKKVAKKA